ncbi:fungal-specific transcription factor domain-containing protein [Halenospora varia]|nr:fungal-specific transcription factor domain-containing protein [Halenospora varia]
MAPRSGCQRCRDRHLRCITNEGATSCEQCAKNKCECTRAGRFKFKLVRSVPQRRHGDTGKVFFVYSPTQTWVNTPAAVDFVTDPCGLEEETESAASSPVSPRSGSTESPLPCTPLANLQDPDFHDNIHAELSLGGEEAAIEGLLDLSNLGSNNGGGLRSQWHAPHTEDRESPSHPNQAPPFVQSEISGNSPLDISNGASFSFQSPASQTSTPSRCSSVQLSGREAILLRNYIENISPWADAGDPRNHFGTIVPQRAMQHPILLRAIFAVSAQNMSRVSTYDEREGPHYYSECISLLIPTISQVEEDCDENILAATVILRMYEETSVEDTRCHLLGSTRLVNSITRFSSSGGLGEAASWVILRQVIYISLVSKEPMSIQLENYEQSHSFLKQDDYSWTNIMVLLFAKVLSIVFIPQENVSAADWLGLEAAIEKWNVSRPDTFNQLSVHEGAFAKQGAFPEIWMLGASNVVGVQYYHLAKLFIQDYKPVVARTGFDFLKAIREKENFVNANVGIILGLALGNPKVQNGWFTTSHTLSAYGCYLRRPEERQVALEFLRDMQKAMGWNNCQVVASLLQEQWVALDGNYGR